MNIDEWVCKFMKIIDNLILYTRNLLYSLLIEEMKSVCLVEIVDWLTIFGTNASY